MRSRRKATSLSYPSSPTTSASARNSRNNNRHNRYVDNCQTANDDDDDDAEFGSAASRRRRHHGYRHPSNLMNKMILLTALAVSCLLLPGDAFVLDGSQNSFAQFRKWYTGLNGTLELEFKTEQPNGLVLYTDDGGTYDFFELKLVEGALRLRYNLGGGAQIITVGRDLHDGHWHKVQVSVRGRVAVGLEIVRQFDSQYSSHLFMILMFGFVQKTSCHANSWHSDVFRLSAKHFFFSFSDLQTKLIFFVCTGIR